MDHEIRIERLTYDPDQDIVRAELVGELGGRNVDVQLQFPFRAHVDRPGVDLRAIALLEIQQILRSASIVTLPDVTDPSGGVVTASPATEQNGTANWDNEGGAVRAQRREIVWFGI